MRIPGLSFLIRILPSILVIVIIALALYAIWRLWLKDVLVSLVSRFKGWREDRKLERDIQSVLRKR